MTTKKKLLVAGLLVVVISSAVGYSIFARNRGVIAVQTGRVVRQDLTQTVSANGEIKPKKYVNISSNTMGRIACVCGCARPSTACAHEPVNGGTRKTGQCVRRRLGSGQSPSILTGCNGG